MALYNNITTVVSRPSWQAHAEKVDKRNEDIMGIMKDLHFGNYAKIEFVNECALPLPPASERQDLSLRHR